MKICFMGSMDFAVEILNTLAKTHQVALVVTQPDKPVGRKQVLKGTPVKEKALELGIELFQPQDIKIDYQRIIEEEYDFIIVAAYGQIIPDIILNHGKYKAINVHASLLPKYRGGSPMHRAIMNGDLKSGVSIMYMAKKMDSGPVLSQREVEIDLLDDVKSLELKLAKAGAELLIIEMEKIQKGLSEANDQNLDKVTYAYHIKTKERVVDFNQPAENIYNQVRGLHPWPIAEFSVDNQKIKVFKVETESENLSNRPGKIVKIDKKGVYIQTSSGLVILKDIQLQGKKRMDITSFMNGVGRSIFELEKVI